MNDGTFQKIDSPDYGAIGPPSILVCGFSTQIESTVKKVLESVGADKHQVLFCTSSMVKQPLGQALESSESSGEPAAPDKLPRAMVLSGLSGAQLQGFISGYRTSGLPRPIFASVTPINLDFPVGKLLVELLREQREMSKPR